MSAPDPPTPPNPVETAKASTSTNVGTAIANANLNNVMLAGGPQSPGFNSTPLSECSAATLTAYFAR